MSHRIYSRQSSGRFRRATLENTFGLRAPSCPECHQLNPHGVDEPEPENCHACGAKLRPEPPEPRYACEDCEWPWPLPGKPPEGSECDSCGGELVAVS
jgi:hypothetical protein